ncbi:hypothetical protein QTP70_001667 [Hemibagrus guttatus]|uniref:Reverse transcriptase n=1 Tax=Hemibagrus guttatus TaxID=175788 RepID=A0AAE0R6K2_9TELE|nr:hypothetical protein QTP70_001667 [Hemibagrus guttatus]
MGMVFFLPGWSLISDTTASARISKCLADISSCMTAHQLKLNSSKTELLVIPGDPSPAHDLAISLSNSMISPSASARNLGVTMDNQLSFSSHVTNVTRSCRFLLYNIRRIRPFLSTQATQVLVQSLVILRLDYCNSLLAGLPLNAIRPLQMIQNAAARLVFNLPKFSHTTPLLRSLHWLPVAARIRFKTLMLAYKAKNGPAPSYLKALITPCTASRSLRSTSTAQLVPSSLRAKVFRETSCQIEDRSSHQESGVPSAPTWGVNVSLSSGYHKQSNRQTKYLNQEIVRYLRSYCSREQQRWSEFLPWADSAQNSFTHSSTGLTPFHPEVPATSVSMTGPAIVRRSGKAPTSTCSKLFDNKGSRRIANWSGCQRRT